uniref:Major sperm protein n=1 Tax=Parastrongyloides trichosuri TaxID=131310 RepID=A0A0N4ZKP7_PARTI
MTNNTIELDSGKKNDNNTNNVNQLNFPPHVMENNFMLSIEPRLTDKLYFNGPMDKQLTTYITLTNRDDYKQAFKVKCSKNETFKIKPSFGVLQHGEKAKICITYIPTPNFEKEVYRHHFGIFHIPCSEGAHPLAIWETHYGPPQGSLRLRIEFIKED